MNDSSLARHALEELARRKLKCEAILSDLHALQREVILDRSRFKAVLAGRRAGKTTMDASYLAIDLESCGRKDWCFYSAVTRTQAKDLIWGELKELNTKYELGWHMKEHEGLVETKRGAHLRLLGFDKMPEVEKACGYRIKLFICDEPHSYAKRLQYLVEQKLTAALSDLAGTLLLNGTPGLGRFGYWFKASTGKMPGYYTRHWTVRQNTRYPRDVEAMLSEERALKQWTEDNAAYRREFMAEWCEDPEATVYAYVEDRNACDSVDIDPSGLFSLGVDFGVKNATSWTVWYSPPQTRKAFCIHSSKISGLLTDAVADITKKLVDQYKPKLVGDAGGLGKTYVESWNKRYGNNAGMFMKPADKQGKLAHIRTLNDCLRTGDAQVVESACAPLIDEWSNLIWEDERKEKEDPQCDNDCADSALYGFTEHASYWQAEAPPPPTPDEAALRAQMDRINRAQAALRAEQSYEEDY